MGSTRQASVLVVEDRIYTAEAMRRAIKEHPQLDSCHVAHNLESGFTLLNRIRPRILLCDLGLPDGSGLDLIRGAAKADWTCDSMVISIFGNEENVFDALNAGARGYISKNEAPANIGDTVVDLINGGSPMSPRVARFLLNKLNAFDRMQADAVPIFQDENKLSNRELQVLSLIGQGLRRQDVAEQLNISIGTVGNHVHKIYSKLGVRSNTEAIAAAHRNGLL